MPSITASQVSCTTSAADSSVDTNERATLSIPPDQRSSSTATMSSSPARNRAMSTSSAGSAAIGSS
ncbi:hypothetical protein OG474_37895 [Kribbella sp. NBC_01505]|uniref:hypothetical protein n=1 Tax=Kribbella sp. NBC_01505 TaxID=2903580 RepID=UPI00386407CE